MFLSTLKEVKFQSWHKKLHDIDEVLVISCWDERKKDQTFLDLRCPEKVIEEFMNPEELKRGAEIDVEVYWYQLPFNKDCLNYYIIGEVLSITVRK